jgi:hypothetical protein
MHKRRLGSPTGNTLFIDACGNTATTDTSGSRVAFNLNNKEVATFVTGNSSSYSSDSSGSLLVNGNILSNGPLISYSSLNLLGVTPEIYVPSATTPLKISTTQGIKLENGPVDLNGNNIKNCNNVYSSSAEENIRFQSGKINDPSGAILYCKGISAVGTPSTSVDVSVYNGRLNLTGNNIINCGQTISFGNLPGYNIKYIQGHSGSVGDKSVNFYFNNEDNLYSKSLIWSGSFKASYMVESFGAVTAATYMQAPYFNATSDYRVKENIELIQESFLDNLRPVTYSLKDSGKLSIGFIAHELQEWYPELVEGEKDGEKMQSINYTGLIPVLVKEVQDLRKENKKMYQQIQQLLERMDDLEQRF